MPYFLTPKGSKLPQGRFSKKRAKNQYKPKDYHADYSSAPKYMSTRKSDSILLLEKKNLKLKKGW